MNDLISRQAAIATAISGRVRTLPTTEDGEDWIRVNEVRESLLNLPTASPRWIPVTERLPEPYSGEYLVTINDGSVYTDILWFDSPGDGMYESCFYKTDDDGYGVVCDDVTAWMPLPKPWKGADNGLN